MTGILIPEMVIYQTLENITKYIRDDLSKVQPDGEGKYDYSNTFLFRLLGLDDDNNPMKMNRYNYFIQAKKIFDNMKNLSVNIGYNFEVAKIISFHIILPSEQPASVAIGEDEGYFTEQDETTGKTQLKFCQMFSSNYQIMITSDNSSEVNLVYHIYKSLFIALVPHFSLKGLLNPKFSGNDIVFQDDTMPMGIFHKVLNIHFDYELIVPQLLLADMIRNISFTPTMPIDDENANVSRDVVIGGKKFIEPGVYEIRKRIFHSLILVPNVLSIVRLRDDASIEWYLDRIGNQPSDPTDIQVRVDKSVIYTLPDYYTKTWTRNKNSSVGLPVCNYDGLEVDPDEVDIEDKSIAIIQDSSVVGLSEGETVLLARYNDIAAQARILVVDDKNMYERHDITHLSLITRDVPESVLPCDFIDYDENGNWILTTTYKQPHVTSLFVNEISDLGWAVYVVRWQEKPEPINNVTLDQNLIYENTYPLTYYISTGYLRKDAFYNNDDCYIVVSGSGKQSNTVPNFRWSDGEGNWYWFVKNSYKSEPSYSMMTFCNLAVLSFAPEYCRVNITINYKKIIVKGNINPFLSVTDPADQTACAPYTSPDYPRGVSDSVTNGTQKVYLKNLPTENGSITFNNVFIYRKDSSGRNYGQGIGLYSPGLPNIYCSVSIYITDIDFEWLD